MLTGGRQPDQKRPQRRAGTVEKSIGKKKKGPKGPSPAMVASLPSPTDGESLIESSQAPAVRTGSSPTN